MTRSFLFLAFLLCASTAAAQDAGHLQALAAADLPRDARSRLEALIGDPSTTRSAGATRISRGEVVDGALAVVDGSLVLAGRVEGAVVVLRGTFTLEPEAHVAGDVTVVCGEVRGATSAIAGTLTVYDWAFCGESPRSRPTRAVASEPRQRWDEYDSRSPGSAQLVVRFGRNYNRVEGLPIRLGPVIETGGRAPLRIEALAVLRTDARFDADDVGYDVVAEQSFEPSRTFRLGAGVRSVVEPIEPAGVRDLEATLAAVVFRHDTRDYVMREGWSAFARWVPRSSPFDATLTYRDEMHGSLAAGGAWSLFNSGDSWRMQPLVAEGSVRTLEGRVEYDTRDKSASPTRGWYLSAALEQGVGGSLRVPDRFGQPVPEVELAPFLQGHEVDTDFTTARIELRRYQRVGLHGLLNLRAVVAGSIRDEALPAQYQHALGGIGSLPGYSTFNADCGARSARVSRQIGGSEFFAGYGCDRVALLQLEYIGDFGLDFDFFRHRAMAPNPQDWWDWDLDFSPTWVVFFDAGHGWALGDSPSVTSRADTGMLYDAGLGLLFGDLGIYAAMPLGQESRRVHLFMRLGRRF